METIYKKSMITHDNSSINIGDYPWIMDYHNLWGIPIKTTYSLVEYCRVVGNGGPDFRGLTCFIQKPLEKTQQTQKAGPPFPSISNHSLLLGIFPWFSHCFPGFPMVFPLFSHGFPGFPMVFLRHRKELARRHRPRQDGRGILRSGTPRDAWDGPKGGST